MSEQSAERKSLSATPYRDVAAAVREVLAESFGSCQEGRSFNNLVVDTTDGRRFHLSVGEPYDRPSSFATRDNEQG